MALVSQHDYPSGGSPIESSVSIRIPFLWSFKDRPISERNKTKWRQRSINRYHVDASPRSFSSQGYANVIRITARLADRIPLPGE